MLRIAAPVLASLLSLVLFAMPGAQKESAPSHSSQATHEILELEEETKQAALHRDVAFVEKRYADDYLAITPLGDVVNKADTIAARKSAQLHYDSISLSEMVVRVYGDTAVVTARADVKGTDLGSDFSGPYRFTRVWVKRNGQWEVVSYEATVTR
jgi:ketosteroid isomerase-like protein